MLLKNKIAVIYGAGGAIGSAVARAFAEQGAQLFLTGRRPEPIEDLAQKINASGGAAQAAPVDALDEGAITRHLDTVIERAGRVDVSFNAIGLTTRKLIGIPLLELSAEKFVMPVTNYALSYFLTARLAARQMAARRSGVIMTVSALPARTGTRLNGGYGAAMAAKEALTRDLSAELASQGVRVVGLRPHAMPETSTMKAVFEAKAPGTSWAQFQQQLAGMSHTQRVMTLGEVGSLAAFLASDGASGITGTTINLTMGGAAD